MDDIKPNRSMDGLQGTGSNQYGGQPQSVNQTQGVAPAPSTGGLDQFNDSDYAPETPSQPPVTNEQQFSPVTSGPKGSSKKLKILLTVFIVLFVAASAAAVYFYLQYNKKPAPVAVDVTKLKQQNDSLTYDNKTLTTQKTQYEVQIKSLQTTAQQLKTKCGTGCSAIVIPQ